MQVDDETWAAVRLAYADASVPLAEIAARFGLIPLHIGARAKREGWEGWEARRTAKPAKTRSTKARSTKARAAKPCPSTRPSLSTTPTASLRWTSPDGEPEDPAPTEAPARKASRGRLPTRDARKSVIVRLYRAISLKLEHMEKRMASGEPRSAQDEERESRALATLISNFEKVTEAVTELDKDGDAGRAAGRDGADAERMRREIAERLERLGGSGALERGSRKSRS
jgi:hypothetical protein